MALSKNDLSKEITLLYFVVDRSVCILSKYQFHTIVKRTMRVSILRPIKRNNYCFKRLNNINVVVGCVNVKTNNEWLEKQVEEWIP